MFDQQAIGKRISKYRKAKDMTQMELANQLGITYQAVSNWERGNAMPDIGNIKDLSSLLGVTLEELLGDEEQSTVIEKVLQEDPIELEEAVEILPILKPSQIEKTVGNNLHNLSINIVIKLAPYLDSSTLMEYLSNVEYKAKDLVVLAPFLDQEDLVSLVHDDLEIDGNLLIKLAPFFDETTMDQLAPKVSLRHLTSIAPFLSKETLDRIVDERMGEELLERGSGLYPFLSKTTVKKIFNYCVENNHVEHLSALMPFVDIY